MNTLTRKERLLFVILLATAAIGLYFGWRLFYFETDDAYIAFRYISNSQLGLGYVWNAPPFRPVEGYTSFLWVAILDLVWRVTHIPPTQAANPLLLCFAIGTLVLTALMIVRLRWPARLMPYRLLFAGLGLAGLLSNRTFLTWSSSGLETAMFNFFFLLWVYFVLYEPPLTTRWLSRMALTATLLYFSRPDGALMLAATGLLGLLTMARHLRRPKQLAIHAISMLPMAAIPIHLLWRKSFYGEWLPNTYFAKSMPGRVWPEAGLRYMGSFMIEYGLLPWLLLMLVFVLVLLLARQVSLKRLLLLDVDPFEYLRRPQAEACSFNSKPVAHLGIGVLLLTALALSCYFHVAGRPLVAGVLFAASLYPLVIFGLYQRSLIEVVAISAVLGQFAYYTFLIGGDHFEFRVYSNLIPLIMVSLMWLLTRMTTSLRSALAIAAVVLLFTLPVQWLHWSYTHTLNTREETRYLKVRVSEKLLQQTKSLPGPIFDYLAWYDDMQGWLIDHGASVRHQEHKVFFKGVSEEVLPPREQGALISNEGYPVIVAGTVGLTAWDLPYVNVLDYFGLNDYVIARNRVKFEEIPMAHERIPPNGYLGCFEPNVEIANRQAIVTPRAVPLTAEQIIACETYYAGIYRNP